MILGIAGRARHGKDSIADILVKEFGFKRIALADPLKQICSEVFKIPLQCFYKDELKDSAFIEPEIIDIYHIERLVKQLTEYVNITESIVQNLNTNGVGKELKSPREILQFVGTDLCRNHVSDTIWLDIFSATVKKAEGNLVCTDARFQNERKLISELGGKNMLVVRPGITNSDSHSSENSLGDESEYSIVVTNSGTLADLHREITTWYTLTSIK
jgi:hypothetical protein